MKYARGVHIGLITAKNFYLGVIFHSYEINSTLMTPVLFSRLVNSFTARQINRDDAEIISLYLRCFAAVSLRNIFLGTLENTLNCSNVSPTLYSIYYTWRCCERRSITRPLVFSKYSLFSVNFKRLFRTEFGYA